MFGRKEEPVKINYKLLYGIVYKLRYLRENYDMNIDQEVYQLYDYLTNIGVNLSYMSMVRHPRPSNTVNSSYIDALSSWIESDRIRENIYMADKRKSFFPVNENPDKEKRRDQELRLEILKCVTSSINMNTVPHNFEVLNNSGREKFLCPLLDTIYDWVTQGQKID